MKIKNQLIKIERELMKINQGVMMMKNYYLGEVFRITNLKDKSQ